MGATRLLARAARFSRRRDTKLRDPRAADMMVYSWLVIVIFGRFTYNCLWAAHELAVGRMEVGSAIVEFSLAHFLLLAFLVPFLASFRSAGGLNRRRLVLAAVPSRSLVLSVLLLAASSPLNGAVAAFVVPPAVPLLRLPHPVASIVALLVSAAAAILLAHAAARALSLTAILRRAGGLFRYAFAAGLLVLVLANFDFQWNAGTIDVLVFQRRILLDDAAGSGLLAQLRHGSPSQWIFDGRIGLCVAAAAAAAARFILAELTAYRGALRQQAGPPSLGFPIRRERRRPSAPRPPSAPRGTIREVLLRQELRSLGSLAGTTLGLLIGLGCSAWLLAAREPTMNIAFLGSVLATAASFAYPSNVFGRDGKALRRYALAAPDWGTIFLAKNLAWLAACGLSFLPLVLATLVRVSPAAALSLLLVCCVVLALCVLWGNISSMLFPVAQSAAAGGAAPRAIFVNQAAPFVFWALALGIDRSAGAFGSAAFDLTFAALLVAGLASYRALLRRITRQFDRDVETVLERF